MLVAAGYSLAQAFAFAYICSPADRYWDSSVTGSCLDANMAYIVTAGLNVGADMTILLLPIWLLWPLNMHPRQKIVLTFLFMTGGL